LNQNILSLSLATTKSKVGGLKKLIWQVQSDSKDDSKVDIGESTVEAVWTKHHKQTHLGLEYQQWCNDALKLALRYQQMLPNGV
jgi:hypothetical protein